MELTVFATLGVVLGLAFMVETLTEAFFGTVAGWIVAIWPNATGALGYYKTPVIQTLCFAAGIYGAFLFRFDLVWLLGNYLQAPDVPLTAYGMVATGLAIGKGSNYLHQLISQFFPAK